MHMLVWVYDTFQTLIEWSHRKDAIISVVQENDRFVGVKTDAIAFSKKVNA